MTKQDPRIDAYISKSAEFAKPILNRFRKLVHTSCPNVEETLKWGFPHFLFNGILCCMASFKTHCAIGFWKGSVMKDPQKVMTKTGETAMGHFGRLTQISDLPSDSVLTNYIKEAMKLNEEEIKIPSRTKTAQKKELIIPDYLSDGLKKNKKALSTFESFNHSNKKDYVEWITSAKTEETRKKRLGAAIEWMAEGKIRNWKYVCK